MKLQIPKPSVAKGPTPAEERAAQKFVAYIKACAAQPAVYVDIDAHGRERQSKYTPAEAFEKLAIMVRRTVADARRQGVTDRAELLKVARAYQLSFNAGRVALDLPAIVDRELNGS